MADALVRWLLTDITVTMSVLELIWSVMAVFAWVRYAHRALHAYGSLRRLRALQQSPVLQHQPRLSVVAREKIRLQRFLFLTIMAECLALIGFVALGQPPSIAADEGDPVAVVAPLLFLVMEVCLVTKGELIERNERALAWLYRQEYPEDDVVDAAIEGRQ